MSHVPTVVLVLFVSLLCCSCDVADPIQADGADATLRKENAGQHAVEIPFRASAFTELRSLAPDPTCGDPPFFLNTQVGEGRATHLGRFSVEFTFCVDASDLLDDGVLSEGESLPYTDGVGVLVAANGDELYLSIAGTVVPSEDPDYDFQFQDPFDFAGGTGRFEGATGSGVTDSFVSQATDRTDHTWNGTLIVQRGK